MRDEMDYMDVDSFLRHNNVDCLSTICPKCGQDAEWPDCEHCGYLFASENPSREHGEHRELHNRLNSDGNIFSKFEPDGEKFFRGHNVPEQSSQPSQSSHATNMPSLGALIEKETIAPANPKVDELVEAIKIVEDCIGKCGENPSILASESFIKAAKQVRESSLPDWLRLRVELKEKKPSGVPMGDIDNATKPSAESMNEGSVADDLVDLVRREGHLVTVKK
jgi:hypothetical protein